MRNITILLFAFVVFLGGCANNSSREQEKQEKEKQRKLDSLALKIAVTPTLDCLPLFIAKERDMFSSKELDVRLKRFKADMDCDTAFVSGSVDGMFSDLARTMRIESKGLPVEYLSVTNKSWKLIANRIARLKHTYQFNDKMIAITRYSAIDYLTTKVFESVKLKDPFYRIQVNDTAIRLKMLTNNELDAAWLPEPQAAVALHSKNNQLSDSRDLKVSLGVLAFRKKCFSNEHKKQQIKALAEIYNAACDSINKNGLSAYSAIIKKYCNQSEDVASSIKYDKYQHITPVSNESKALMQKYLGNN